MFQVTFPQKSNSGIQQLQTSLKYHFTKGFLASTAYHLYIIYIFALKKYLTNFVLKKKSFS